LVVRTVRLAEGADAVEQVRADVQSALDDFARQSGKPVAGLPPVLIALYLEPDVRLGRNVTAETLDALPSLFTWDAPRAVVLAETSSHPVMERLDRELDWTRGTVITVGDYGNVGDALEQMRRDAPGVRNWPEPDTQILAQALGLRPISMSLAAKDIQAQAGGSQRLVAVRLRQQLEAIAHEESPEGKYAALIRNSIDSLSPEARDLLALMTVLHPKPTLFPDEMAVALDLSLDLDDAISIATAEDESELDADQREHRDKADELVAELVRRGLLERLPRRGAARMTPRSSRSTRLTSGPFTITCRSPRRGASRAMPGRRRSTAPGSGRRWADRSATASGWKTTPGGTTPRSGSTTSAT
jgi:hypothetical protein